MQHKKCKKPCKRGAATRRKPAVMVVQNGQGLMDLLKGANKFLKDTKLISGLAGVASAIPGLGEFASPVAGISGALGYGKKPRRKSGPKKKRGKGLNPGGGSLTLAGQRKPIR